MANHPTPRPRAHGTVDLPPGVIMEQLRRTTSSRQFENTRRLKHLLTYLVERTLAGAADQLKGYTIGVEVFDRPADFDPQLDTIVRVQAGKLRQRLDLYYADEGRDDPLRIYVPRGSYVPVFQLALDRESSDASHVQAPTLPPAGYRPRVAVLPLKHLGVDESDAYLAEGLTEEIATALSRFRDITVLTGAVSPPGTTEEGSRSRSSTDYQLLGSVRRAGSTVRVTIRLLDGATGAHLMSEAYDKRFSQETLLQIQDEIATHVAAEIAEPRGVLARVDSRWAGPGGRQGLNHDDAYDAVLEAFAYSRRPSPERHLRIRNRLEASVVRSPTHSSAWAMLSMVTLDEVRAHYNPRPESATLVRALDAAQRAVECDPLNANAYYALFLCHFHRSDITQFHEAGKRALALNAASPDILADLGACTAFMGQWDRGIALIERACTLSLDPPPWYFVVYAVNEYRQRNYDAALVHVRRINPWSWHWGLLIELMILGQLDRRADAAPLVAQVLQLVPRFPKRAREECALWNLDHHLVEHIVDGWSKAGLDIL